jgi:gamma-glutamyl hercynylcysteine S-oxide synthase
MSTAASLIDPRVHDAQLMRGAGADLLQLALMDARNRTLGWLTAFDSLPLVNPFDDFDPPAWLAGQAAWHQEYWIARHLQRQRGAAADPAGMRLASIEPRADGWFDPQACARPQRWLQPGPSAVELRQYLADTLELTLELLDKAGDDDGALHVFRQALWHEDRIGESLAVLVQVLDLGPERCQPLIDTGLWPTLPSRGRREPLWLPGQRGVLGSPAGGFVPEAEQGEHPVTVEAFEIDAQPVSWSQFAEFVDDGGYDDRRWWSVAGWDLLEASTRRAPRYVEQLGAGVLARRQGRLQRVPAAQAALHVNAHEAEAWCRWAGRRLPSEAEWALAAISAGARGFAWGEVAEWVAGSARAFPGAPAAAQPAVSEPPLRVQRGASAWGSPRLRHPGARQYVAPSRDDGFVGFRSCAV